MNYNSKRKGNIGEAVVIAELCKLGNPVSIPFGDNERYDLIVESKTGKLLKAQTKYSSEISENGSLIFSVASSTNHTTNKHFTTYSDDVDLFFFYHTLTKKVYVFSINLIKNKKTMTLRISAPNNNQKKGIHFANDYVLTEKI